MGASLSRKILLAEEVNPDFSPRFWKGGFTTCGVNRKRCHSEEPKAAKKLALFLKIRRATWAG
jgi:hypothetical protein